MVFAAMNDIPVTFHLLLSEKSAARVPGEVVPFWLA